MQNQVIAPERARHPATPRAEGMYRINEMFWSLQGEGRLAGTPMLFVRFSDCNLRCTQRNAGFDCDTEFVSGRVMDASELLLSACAIGGFERPEGRWLLLTGGEPGLQLDRTLIDRAHKDGWKLAIETNGTVGLPDGLDWICVSPKSAEHTLRQLTADEVKYVRHAGMAIPETRVKAHHYLISPAFQPDMSVREDDLEWCKQLVMDNPPWALSLQLHKLLRVR